MDLCQREDLHQVDLLSPAAVRITEEEYRAQKRGQENLDKLNAEIRAAQMIPRYTTFQTQKQFLRDAITETASNWLCVAEDEGLTISDPTPQAMIIRDSEDVISLIQVDTTEYRAATENHTVRINVTLPAWMANFADKRN